MEKEKNNRLPLILLGMLTLLLLIIFGYQQFTNKDFNKQNVLSELYFEVFKPIFSNESITKEDVLTFAVKGDLPLNNSNKILKVQVNSNGKEVLEIKNEEGKDTNNYYETVINELQLDEKGKVELDSILEFYRGEFYKLVYHDDESSSIAVDPQIALLRNSLNQDLSYFMIKEKDTLLSNILSSRNRLHNTLEKAEDEKTRNYIVFTGDSVMQSKYSLISAEQNDASEMMLLKTPESSEIFSTDNNNKISFKIDSNLTKVVFDNVYLENINLDEINIFKMVIDSVKKDIRFSIEVEEDSSDNISVKLSFTDSLNNKVNYEMNSDDIGTALSNSLKMFSGKNLGEWIEFGIEMDSISRAIDSIEEQSETEINWGSK